MTIVMHRATVSVDCRQWRLSFGCDRDTPDLVADVIGNQQRAIFVDGQPDRPATGLVLGVQKAGHDILCHPIGMPIFERHEDHLVAIQRGPIPTAMLADERTALIDLRQRAAGVEG